ncbi:Peptidase M1 leukotriene A4 hydrolase/aminopeptidase C-terminal [Trinorchestia longiramus]|nr:Peptidase M1 leukotriene A4 hydrolase/aminopeptidase C-terminal [Trinorchestia longiramus]
MSVEENDLPLLSNIKTVRARHYVWCAHPVFASRSVAGQVIIVFSSPTACELSCNTCAQCKCQSRATSESDGLSNCCTLLDYEYCEGELKIPVVLDVKDLVIKSVSSVACSLQDLEKYLDPGSVKNDPTVSNKLFYCERDQIEFEVEPWSIKFECSKKLPFAIYIEYHTTETSASLSWRNEKNNPCFFTSGTAINNRSLLPCQDAPSALATWEAFISIDSAFHVSMSGDEPGMEVDLHCSALAVNQQHQNTSFNSSERCLYFYSSLPLPLATLAIAAGVWLVENVIIPSSLQMRFSKEEKMLYSFKETFNAAGVEPVSSKKKCTHEVLCCHSRYPCLIKKKIKLECELQNCAEDTYSAHGFSEYPSIGCKLPPVCNNSHFQDNACETWSSVRMIPSTLVYPASLGDQLQPLREFLPHCLFAAGELLGPHPCPRLEVIVMPPSFASLGLASPNLVFLAPCVAAAGDSSTFLRIAHEISHAWFGIIIGAVDWTEEWLSEGFATFTEELIYERASVSYKEILLKRKNEHPELKTQNGLHEILRGSCENNVLATCPSSESNDNMGSRETIYCENKLNVCGASNDLGDNSTEQTLITEDNGDTPVIEERNLVSTSNILRDDGVQKDVAPQLLIALDHTKVSRVSFSPSPKRQKINESFVFSAAATDFCCKFSSWEKMVLSMDESIRKELLAIRDYLRYKKLTQEIQVTDESLQTLLPSSENSAESGKYVVNGLQKDKPFLNVHYIKGFFFLKYLCGQVGELNFIKFLKKFVLNFHGLLITSKNFIEYFCAEFPELSACKSELVLEWLQSPGVNEQLKNMNDAASMETCLSEAHCAFWTKLTSRKPVKDYERSLKEIGHLYYPERIQLFLEYLLEYNGHLTKQTMLAIEQLYDLEHQNSDVRHGWCELIIKHNYRPASRSVEKFLAGDQAMGIYLYGELMISGAQFWQALAKRMYQILKDNMEENTKINICEMLYPV